MSDAVEYRPGDLVTVAEALRIMPVGRTTLYALIADGALPHYRVSSAGSHRGRVLLARTDLEAFLRACRHGATVAPVAPDVDAIHRRVRRNLPGTGGKAARTAET